MFQNIFFDWSGVVNDNCEAIHGCYMEIFRTFGAKEITLEQFRQEFKTPYMDFMHRHIPGISQKDQGNLFTKTIFKYEKNRKYSSVDESIKKFFRQGKKMFVISCDLKETLHPQVKSFGLEGIFTEIVCDVYDKTDAARSIIERHQLNPDETIFLGDSNHEIEVSRKLGIKSGAVIWGNCTEENLSEHHPDFMIHNLAELENIVGISHN